MCVPKFETIPYENRIQFLRQFVAPQLLGIEIGASHAPIASRSDGYNTIIIDALSAPALRKKYTAININIEQIEEVDYIWRGEKLSKLVSQSGDLNYILASHVIEHIPNFIDFFQQSDELLNSEGQLILAIPDKRKCFDYFRPISTTGQVLQAFHENKQVHSMSAIFDSHANYAEYEGYGSWFSSTKTDNKINLESNVKGAYQKYLQLLSKNEYEDVHGWVFTPASFLLIIHDLTTLGLINLSLKTFYLSEGHEFYAIFYKNSQNPEENIIKKWSRKQLQKWIVQNL